MPSAAARVVGIPRPVNIPIGKAYYVPTQFFLNKVLPRPPAGLNLNTTIEKAPRTVVTQYGKLWGYSDKSPAGVRKKGVNNAFASLSRGIHTIVKTVDSHRPTIIFYHNKEGRADFQQRPTNSLPDAFFIPAATPAGFVQWSDVAVFGEYRKGGSQDDINENIKKASQTMRNCMRNDPRRRFLYGFTAEDSHMKFWYCDRSQIVLSEPFNFIEEPHNLLRFVLSLSFAPLHQLGWDPTMTPMTKDGKLQYDITLRTNQDDLRVYRTISVLSDHTAHDVLGRASRVWKAVRLVDGEETGEPVALKDSWVDSTREREGDVYAKVMQAILAEGREQEAKNLFVTVQAHGDVYVAGSQDRTPSFLSQRRERFAASKDSAVPGPSSGKASEWIESRYQVHHRIVFNEVGQPLAEVTSLETMFKVLHDVFRAAAVMHKSGWVHRDISAGNILIVNGSGRLTDLEYALNEEYQDEPGRTGTPFFVAVEIDSGNYLFDPILKRIPQPEASKKPTALDILMKTGYLGPLDAEDTVRFESPPPTPPFRYNPLHDLESLWWIAVYFTLNRETDGAHDQVAQRSAVREFFYNHENRQHALLLPTYFADKVRCLHASLGDIAKLLNKLRALLSRAYREAEKTFQPIDFCVANEYHDVIASIFQAAAEYSKVKKISIRRFSDTTWDNITC